MNSPSSRTRIWTFIPALPCLTDHRSRRPRQPGQGKRVPSTTKVAVPGHLLRGEQQDHRGPGERLRQGLDGPRNSGLRHAQDLSDHRLHDVLTQVHRSRPQRPGQAQDRRITLDTLLSQPGEQPVELIISGPWYTPSRWPTPSGVMAVVSQTPMTPHGGGPSSYRLPEMTQDTPRITFPDDPTSSPGESTRTDYRRPPHTLEQTITATPSLYVFKTTS